MHERRRRMSGARWARDFAQGDSRSGPSDVKYPVRRGGDRAVARGCTHPYHLAVPTYGSHCRPSVLMRDTPRMIFTVVVLSACLGVVPPCQAEEGDGAALPGASEAAAVAEDEGLRAIRERLAEDDYAGGA